MRFLDTVSIHPTALIEENVTIGSHSAVWDHVHIRRGAVIGEYTTIGEKTYVAYEVKIGNYVKINAMVYIPFGVLIEDQCMISAGVVFTNDLYPRAMNPQLTALQSSLPNEETLLTKVCQGTTIGANATIGPGLIIGPYAMIGMGAVVTHDVPPYGLVLGNPARLVGHVCVCGQKICGPLLQGKKQQVCPRCQRGYVWNQNALQHLQ